jgi:hypothetical protein
VPGGAFSKEKTNQVRAKVSKVKYLNRTREQGEGVYREEE